ncbi:MAG: hypothetical protein KF909_02585 [Rhodocyclaceae bacterium]|nr:hypothetical protein [Rhodocyclaceae bacterium]MCP5232542.1 hypothetical protein [Zoogloeaceae bacterium]MCB1913603.1 hypothetical protein [Rhodocyclaceae bacterium]MCP5238671.1 hypothetical protein [Zoogloeaceae bacterium]MCP5254397.1 hypothetical protein [Zoogloeaceae bacterium]
MANEEFTLEMARAFHECMATIIDEVQQGIWQAGQHELLGYDTDVGFGQQRGLQTLVLKTSHRSSYLRLHWDTIMGDTKEELARVDDAVRQAINALS